MLDASGLSFCAGAALQLTWIQNPESPRSGRQHKAWGASPRIASGKAIKPAKRATAASFQPIVKPDGYRPLRGLMFIIHERSWGCARKASLHPRLYAVARFAGSIEALVS